ncbi:MAG: hypothetical protein IID36_14585 [Planctomycetes bacterium]|nr:hypothetical protein [Planctomycetota bacterium]
MSEETPVELAILQVVNDLMFVGRQGTANLQRERATILAHNEDHPEHQTDIVELIGHVVSCGVHRGTTSFDQVHEMLVAAEFQNLHA